MPSLLSRLFKSTPSFQNVMWIKVSDTKPGRHLKKFEEQQQQQKKERCQPVNHTTYRDEKSDVPSILQPVYSGGWMASPPTRRASCAAAAVCRAGSHLHSGTFGQFLSGCEHAIYSTHQDIWHQSNTHHQQSKTSFINNE